MIHIVGHTAVDHISRVSSLPVRNGSSTITDRNILFGGGAANIATGIARLGGEVTLVSAVGGDFKGSAYEAWLKENGVYTQFYTVPGKHTATAFMFTDPSGDQITFFEWGASDIFRTSDPPSFPFVHMATADPVFNVKVAEKAGFSSFDPGQDLHRYSAEQLHSIISRVSLLFANQHEVEGMCRMMSISRQDLIGMVPMAVFTRGGEGSILYLEGKEEHIPAIPVRMVDPTGAGDAYRAGFLTAFLKHLPPLICCRVGTVAASHVVEVAGCQTNLPGWEMMKSRYENYFGPLVLNE
ncbi:MAG: carbohydrate kinase family protein [Methanoregulaceae archaeon]|jgi:ribokinase|nr:carbohydrate kinase family protein [Methanoregulaceae archaeon]MCU0628014.1 carbohydrate kinase family protein [Methanoregulaceae archaeon]